MRQFVDAKARALGIRVDHHMRVVIIGGTGHIGSFLTPRLVEAGHPLTCVSRGMKQPYRLIRYIARGKPLLAPQKLVL